MRLLKENNLEDTRIRFRNTENKMLNGYYYILFYFLLNYYNKGNLKNGIRVGKWAEFYIENEKNLLKYYL